MAKLKNDEWLGYGKALTDALAAAITFEKAHAEEFAAMKEQRDKLVAESDRLTAKIAEGEDDLAQVKAGLFKDLEAKVPQFANRSEAATKLESKARSIAGQLHDRGVGLLRLKLEQNAIDQQAAIIAQRPYMARHQAANALFDALIGTAGIGLQFSRGNPSFSHASELDRQGKELAAKLEIVEGRAKNFQALGHSTSDVHDILALAEQLPERALPGLVEAWSQAVAENMERIGMRFSKDGLVWHITRRKPATKIYTTHDNAGDVMGRAAVQ